MHTAAAAACIRWLQETAAADTVTISAYCPVAFLLNLGATAFETARSKAVLNAATNTAAAARDCSRRWIQALFP
jgi:hypothetical protein